MKSNLLRFSILDLYFAVICVFPIFTALVDGTIINKLLFASLVGLHLLCYWTSPMKRKTILSMLWLVIHYIFVIGNTNFPLTNSNLLFYYPFFLMYTHFVCDNREKILRWIKRKNNFIYGVMLTWTLLVGVSIFVPSCYYVKEGGSLYFGSWCNSIFRLGPTAMFIQILALVFMTVFEQKKAILYMIIPMYCMFMGSSRTYLVVGLCILVIGWYIFCDSKKLFWLTAIPLGLLVLVLIFSTSIGDKILYTLDSKRYGDAWYRITSSRSEFWEKDIKAWSEMPMLNQLLGSGINFTYEVSGLWGHNDFVEILCSFGIIGVLHYLYAIRTLFRKLLDGLRIDWVVWLLSIVVWLFNAFFNMHYVYFCAMLSYPFLLFALQSWYSRHREG